MSLMTSDPEAVPLEPVSSPYVHRNGPAILGPVQAIGNIVARTNELIEGHREWLAKLPQRDVQSRRQSTSTTPPTGLITPFPVSNGQLSARQIAAPVVSFDPQLCNSLVASAGNAGAAAAALQFSITFSSVTSTASASIASLQSAINSANSALSSVRASASLAAGSASGSVQAALASATAESQKALAASSSASQAIASVQGAASASVLGVESSASVAVASAVAVASNAQVTATMVIAQAQASVSAASSLASKTASNISPLSDPIFAISIAFSIFGSALFTLILAFFFIRYRRSRTLARQNDLKKTIHRKRGSDESSRLSLSDFPYPANRTQWMQAQRISQAQEEKMEEAIGTYRGSNMAQPFMRGAQHTSTRDSRSMDLPIYGPRTEWGVGPPPIARANRLPDFLSINTEVASAGLPPPRSPLRPVTRPPPLKFRDSSLVPRPLLTGQSVRSQGGDIRPLIGRQATTLLYDPERPNDPPRFAMRDRDEFMPVSPMSVNARESGWESERYTMTPGRDLRRVDARPEVESRPQGPGRIGSAF